MDWTQIIVALITVLGATIGTLLVNLREKNLDKAARAEREATRQAELKKKEEAEKQAHAEQFDNFKADIIKTLEDHRNEYLDSIDKIDKRIDNVESNITDVQASYQQNTAVLELKIETLSKNVEKHNNVIERTYALESKAILLEEQIKVANHRIEDLEKK